MEVDGEFNRVMGRREMSSFRLKKSNNKSYPEDVIIHSDVTRKSHQEDIMVYSDDEIPEFHPAMKCAPSRQLTSKSRTLVIGRRQQRTLVMKYKAGDNWRQVSDNWDSATSEDSGVYSGLSSAGSSRSSLSSSGSSNKQTVTHWNKAKGQGSDNTAALCDKYDVHSQTVKKDTTLMDNTYASILTVPNTPPVRVPPKLPPRNLASTSFDSLDSKTYRDIGKLCNNRVTNCDVHRDQVIVSSKFHTYTIDDIVDSYFNLVSSIPNDSPKRLVHKPGRSQSLYSRKTDSPLRRTRSDVQNRKSSTAKKTTVKFLLDATKEFYI